MANLKESEVQNLVNGKFMMSEKCNLAKNYADHKQKDNSKESVLLIQTSRGWRH